MNVELAENNLRGRIRVAINGSGGGGCARLFPLTLVGHQFGASLVRIVMKVEGIRGESTAHDHFGWIDVDDVEAEKNESFGNYFSDSNWSDSDWSEVTVVKPFDAASASLEAHFLRGDRHDRVEIDWLEGIKVEKTVSQLKLTNVVVTNMVPYTRQSYEKVIFTFEKAEWNYDLYLPMALGL